MNTFAYIVGIGLVSVVIYYARDTWNAREREAYTNRIKRGLETLDEIKEHATEFNKKQILKLSIVLFILLYLIHLC